jgi:hypothetical protein
MNPTSQGYTGDLHKQASAHMSLLEIADFLVTDQGFFLVVVIRPKVLWGFGPT